MTATACDGCLDRGTCWICRGEGCHRCGQTGRCHLCTPQEPARDGEQVAG